MCLWMRALLCEHAPIDREDYAILHEFQAKRLPAELHESYMCPHWASSVAEND